LMSGHWYPGSMSKAMNQLREDLKAIDLVIELLDARIPHSSRNPAFYDLFKHKKHLILLHKADRAENKRTEAWLKYYDSLDAEAMAFSVQGKHYLDQLLKFLKKEEKRIRSGRFKRPLRMIFVGIPNVGKSTLINLFVRKAVTKTGNRPGVTRGKQWIRIMPNMELLDTPGILRPKIDETTVRSLAAVGAIPAGRADIYDAALWLLSCYLEQARSELLKMKYSLCETGPAEAIFEKIGLSQGCLQSEGQVDNERTAALILRDYQNGSLGKLTLEEAPPVN